MTKTTNKLISAALITLTAGLWAIPIHESLITHHVGDSFHTSIKQTNDALIAKISNRYTHVSPELVAEVVEYTHKYAKSDFPKQEDLLAVIAVESSFNPKAKSNLKHDPAIGLTQIRPKAWSHKYKHTEFTSIENQIKYGAEILAHNYKRVGDKELALHAYNLGLTSVLRGKRSKTYVVKYHRELSSLT